MPKRLLLEGADLQALLLRVRVEMGPAAKVVKAERVRSGGIAGFFAKEHFELTIDVPEAEEHGLLGRAAGPARPAVVGLDALLAAADAADAHDDVPAPVSTEQDTFADILDSVRQLATETRHGPAPTGAPVVPTAPPTSVTRPVVVDPAPGEPVVVDSVPLVDVLAADDEAAPTAPTAPIAPTPPAPVILGKRITTPEFVVMRSTGATFGELSDVGFPREVLGRLPASQGRYTLSEVFSHVPRAPRLVRDPSSVVVVAGQGELVIESATALARRLGLPDTGIALAGRLPPLHGFGPWVLTGISARRLRAATVESESPLVVALGVGGDASDWSVASGLIDAFDPDQLWADVEADRSVLDVRRWLRAVGHARAFDALAVRNVSSCAAPAAVLDLGVPVGTIDAVPATAVVWAAAVSERLEDPAWD